MRRRERRTGGILAAMILGDRQGMDPETKELYQVNGIAHILSISGAPPVFYRHRLLPAPEAAHRLLSGGRSSGHRLPAPVYPHDRHRRCGSPLSCHVPPAGGGGHGRQGLRHDHRSGRGGGCGHLVAAACLLRRGISDVLRSYPGDVDPWRADAAIREGAAGR